MADKLTPKFELRVDGAPASALAVASVIGISCRQDLDMADAIEVRLSNDGLEWSDGDTFAEGKKLSVRMGFVETDLQTIVSGEIVRRECEFPQKGASVVTVVAFDREYRLKHGKKSRAFKDQKVCDVVKKLCSEAGLSAEVDDSKIKHKYLFQANQTNLEFIREHARRLGYVVQVDRDNAKVSFKKPATGTAKHVKLKWGVDLLSFRPRFSTDEQVEEVHVRGWDMHKKKHVTGKATPADVFSKMGGSRLGADLAKKSFGKREVLYVDGLTVSDQDAGQLAKAYANSLLHRYAQGEASGQGNNKIVPGAVIEVLGCGKKASGNYYVSSTLHHYEPRGYTTHFTFVRPSDTTAAPPPAKKAKPPPPPKATKLPEPPSLGATAQHGEGAT